jgi:chloride channel 3/4/5
VVLTWFWFEDASYCFSAVTTGDSDTAIQKNGVRPPSLPLQPRPAYTSKSPRVILVEEHGSLKGLVTVKDVLRFNAVERPTGDLHWDAGELEAVLDVMWTWAVGVGDTCVEWYRRLIRR